MQQAHWLNRRKIIGSCKEKYAVLVCFVGVAEGVAACSFSFHEQDFVKNFVLRRSTGGQTVGREVCFSNSKLISHKFEKKE